MKKTNKKLFRHGSTSYKILILTGVFLFVIISFLSPFMLVEDSNKTLALIISICLFVVYLLILLIFIWDHIKAKLELP